MVTAEGTGLMGKVVVDVKLVNSADKVRAADGHLPADQIRSVTVKGIVDTGAAMLVIPESAARALGVAKISETSVRYADHRRATRDVVGNIDLELCGRVNPFTAVVEPSRPDALVGAIVLEALDLIVDCRRQVVEPRDPNIMTTEIE